MAARVKSLSRTFVWILMGLLMAGLAGFGAVNLSGTVRTVATVGDETISVDDYARELQREIRGIEAQTGQALQMSQVRDLGIDQNVLARLVAIAALDNEVAGLGVSIGDENLRKEIVQIPSFQGVDGKFDPEGYRFALDNAGLSEAEFEADLRRESARTLVQGAIMGGLAMPETYAETLARFVGARRSFTMATVTPSTLDEPIAEPTDAEVEAYYAEHPERFMLPQTKRITYALLSPEMLLDSVTLDEGAVRRLYESRESEYHQPERRLVERLVFADDEAAASAKAQLEVGGTTFEQLVQGRGLQLSDVDLGDMTAADLGAAAEAVFAAVVGDVVGPFPTDLGPALFRVNGTLDERITSFESVEGELRDELAGEQARRQIEAQAETLNDMLAGGATLEELARETGMELAQIDWVNDSSEGVAAYSGFRDAATEVTAEDFPEIRFLEDGSVFALRLDEELSPRPEPLESAGDRVAAAWIANETAKALADKAATMVTRLATEGDFTALGLPYRVENALTRTAYIDGTPVDFMEQVFAMEPGDLKVIAGTDAAFIVRLDEILPPAETEELAQMKQALTAQMSQALAQNIFDIYVRDAQTRAQPMLDQRALNAVQTSFQ
ncbi:peptidylprolyl isomerase [Ruegeria marina]|uniref:Peptidyl-prolyl cis-trans isomerase D n=1 Tax=Ruegeria marina TaxID=639004 RepID=A0A1G6IYQ2_9RHOB|nr:peptidylprolyl isomerase [Ruegeria marina]SDC11634.1 peptidyl-prolyl cis-trans isomerase D [Ruegeria marina]